MKRIKKTLLGLACVAGLISSEASAFTRGSTGDLLLAQFDLKPDPDDVHAMAALGCILDKLPTVEYYAVRGTYGIQSGSFIGGTNALCDQAFGSGNWADATSANRAAAVTNVKNRVKAVLARDRKVYVMEAGQSNFTRDWLAALRADSTGPTDTKIKTNVIVVQHGKWNEDKTTPSDLADVKSWATYRPIDDGNLAPGTGTNRGPDTPAYKSSSTSWLANVKSSGNTNAKGRALWTEADRIADGLSYKPSYSVIPDGGVDFSDAVEAWYILGLPSAGTVSEFFNNYAID